MGEEASARIGSAGRGPFEDAVRAFNEYFYDEQGFRGNRDRYDDPRNSFLNEVLNRRTGIPISLAVVYLEVARRAGLRVAGVNFPGHFLLRAPLATPTRLADDVLIVDPFHKGAFLSEIDCRELLRQHVGDAAAFDHSCSSRRRAIRSSCGCSSISSDSTYGCDPSRRRVSSPACC